MVFSAASQAMFELLVEEGRTLPAQQSGTSRYTRLIEEMICDSNANPGADAPGDGVHQRDFGKVPLVKFSTV